MNTQLWKQRLSHYLPAIASFLVGLFFLYVPALAVFLVFSLFAGFAIFYALIVHKYHRLQDEIRAGRGESYGNTGAYREPTFRNVSFQVFRFGDWPKSLNEG